MPLGIQDGWKDYLFRIIDEVDSFQIVTLGLRDDDPNPTIQSKVFYRSDGSRAQLPMEISYATHSDAEVGHLSLVQLALLAESQEEFLELFKLARKNIPISE